MPHEFDPNLAQLTQRVLKAQPSVPAPSTLIPRILASIEARSRLPWWRLSWWDWPITAKLAFCVAAAGLVGFIAGSSQAAFRQMAPFFQSMTNSLAVVTDLWTRLDIQLAGLTSLWGGFAQPWVWFAAGLLVFCYLACVGVGTLVLRLAWRPT